jgi:hypothetical protein
MRRRNSSLASGVQSRMNDERGKGGNRDLEYIICMHTYTRCDICKTRYMNEKKTETHVCDASKEENLVVYAESE